MITIPGLIFKECQKEGYRPRTIENAQADATIAIASDFSTAGELLTRDAVRKFNRTYIPVNMSKRLLVTDELIDYVWSKLMKTRDQLSLLQSLEVNIAGNGIYTVREQYHQEQLDAFVYELLNKVQNQTPDTGVIGGIRSGGQTGIDEAGIVAALNLKIPALILAPKGWRMRDITGKDIEDEYQFKKRFLFPKI